MENLLNNYHVLKESGEKTSGNITWTKCLKILLFPKLFIILLSIEDFLIFRHFRHLGLININGKLIKLSCT